MTPTFDPIPTAEAEALRAGQPDAYGQPAQRLGPSTGAGTPCRHCLKQVPKGADYLLAAWRPFDRPGPYAETGPIFLCAAPCAPGGAELPAEMFSSDQVMLRGYDAQDRIVADSAGIVTLDALTAHCAVLLARPDIVQLHLRSASHGCFLCRVLRP